MGNSNVASISDSPNGGGAALHLDGSGSYVRLGLQDSIPAGDTDFTITAWVKPGLESGKQGILSFGDMNIGAGYELYLDWTSGGKLEFKESSAGSDPVFGLQEAVRMKKLRRGQAWVRLGFRFSSRQTPRRATYFASPVRSRGVTCWWLAQEPKECAPRFHVTLAIKSKKNGAIMDVAA